MWSSVLFFAHFSLLYFCLCQINLSACENMDSYIVLLYGNCYGPVFLQSDCLIAGSYNTIRTTFFNFCRKSSIFQVSVVLASEILQIRQNFYPVLFSNNLIPDKRLKGWLFNGFQILLTAIRPKICDRNKGF